MIISKLTSCWCCFILLLFLSFPAYTQTDIAGRVVDEKDNTALPNVSVYFNNTTIGTYTSREGDFHFEDIRMLNTEMVISCPGYEVLLFKPTANQVEGKRIIFKLRANASATNKLELTDADRKKYLSLFHQFFLGVTEEAAESKVINESTIYFTQGESKTSLSLTADSPLIIINSMLGYKIHFNLVEFWFDNITGQNYYLGYARYEELGDNKKWIRNRKNCYYGGTLHFYRSLVAHQLYQQGFGTFLIKPAKDSAAVKLEIGGIVVPLDSTLVEPFSESDILFIDSNNNLSIRIAGQLLVQYDKNPSAKSFLIQNGFMLDNEVKGVECYIRFKESPIGINYRGVLDDYSNAEYSGYWIYEKVANTLPYNYQPD